MRVLGISPLDKDSTVSFVENGRILFACGEERLSRVKLQDGFPSLALELGLKRTGWTLDSIDGQRQGDAELRIGGSDVRVAEFFLAQECLTDSKFKPVREQSPTQLRFGKLMTDYRRLAL